MAVQFEERRPGCPWITHGGTDYKFELLGLRIQAKVPDGFWREKWISIYIRFSNGFSKWKMTYKNRGRVWSWCYDTLFTFLQSFKCIHCFEVTLCGNRLCQVHCQIFILFLSLIRNHKLHKISKGIRTPVSISIPRIVL